jgi:Ca2+-transporting ATPase
METEFGRIAELTQTVGREITPLQHELAVLARQLGVIAVVVAAFVVTLGWLTGQPAIEMFLTGVALAVAVVPEGLPAVVTITLALGVRAMVRRRALLRRLQAAETLGAATVLCTDKTGTLTQNEMTLRRIWLPAGPVDVTGIGYDPAGHFEHDGHRVDYTERHDLLSTLRSALVCSHARVEETKGWQPIGDPTEVALVVAAYKAWLSTDDSDLLAEFSFNSRRKRMTVVERNPEGLVAHVKGAPEVLLERCTHVLDGTEERRLTSADRANADAAQQRMASTGLRTLAIARRRLPPDVPLDDEAVERELTLLGIVGIIDPPRPEVAGAIAMAQRAGIRVIMITGDASETAMAVAQRVGLHVQGAITGSELESMSDTELESALAHPTVFARTTPENKLRIVRILQRRDEVVGMTGDGVNDAPALKQADIGIAMGIRGTDVAKDAADMVITDDNFASIVEAVEEGRRQYDNIQKFVRYLLSSNTAEVGAIALNIAFGGPLILLPVQILWINLVTDGMTALALGMEPAEPGLMDRPPRDPSARILDAPALAWTAVIGGYMALATLWLFHTHLDGQTENLVRAQTMAFTGIIVFEKINVLNFRAFARPIPVLGLFTNPWLLIALTVTVGLQVAAVYTPFLQGMLHTTALTWSDWVVMIGLGLPLLLAGEMIKWWRYRTQPSRG